MESPVPHHHRQQRSPRQRRDDDDESVDDDEETEDGECDEPEPEEDVDLLVDDVEGQDAEGVVLLHLYIKDAHQGSITDRGSRRQSFTVKRWGESSRGAWRARLTLSQEKELFLNKKILQQLLAFSPAVPKICF